MRSKKLWIIIVVVLVAAALAAATYFGARNQAPSTQPQIESLKANEVEQIEADFQRLMAPLPEATAYLEFKADVERLYVPNQIPMDIKIKLAELKEAKILAELKFYYGSEVKAREELDKMKQSGEYDKLQ